MLNFSKRYEYTSWIWKWKEIRNVKIIEWVYQLLLKSVYQIEIKEIIDILDVDLPSEVSSDILNFYLEKSYFLWIHLIYKKQPVK